MCWSVGQLRPGVTSYKSVCTPDASLPSRLNTATRQTLDLQHLHTAHHCTLQSTVLQATNDLQHVETHEEIDGEEEETNIMSCKVTLPGNSNIIDTKRSESLHL